MALRDQIFSIYKTKDWAACHRVLDEASPGVDREDRNTIAYWRVEVLEREGRYREALDVLDATAHEYHCKCLAAYLKANLLNLIGKTGEAIATLQDAPILEEMQTFPALAREAAYFCCYYMVRVGQPPPANLLDLIPDDFQTMVDGNRFVGKSELLNRPA